VNGSSVEFDELLEENERAMHDAFAAGEPARAIALAEGRIPLLAASRALKLGELLDGNERAIQAAFAAGERELAIELTEERMRLLAEDPAEHAGLEAARCLDLASARWLAESFADRTEALMVGGLELAAAGDHEATGRVERLLQLGDDVVDALDAEDPDLTRELLVKAQREAELLGALCLRRGRENAPELAAEAEREHAARVGADAAELEHAGLPVLADSLRRAQARILAIASGAAPALPEILLARVRVSARRRRPRSRGDRSRRTGCDPPSPSADSAGGREGGAP
jgi:hypothetical protein